MGSVDPNKAPRRKEIEVKNPIQPLAIDEHGILRFKENAIVRHLLDWATTRGMSLNDLAVMEFTDDDRSQFAQLIGYSLDGYGTLSYADDETYDAATLMAEGATEEQARIETLTEQLGSIRSGLRDPVARLFGIHPEDLGGEQD